MKLYRQILLVTLFAVAAFTANAQKKDYVSHTVEKNQTLYSISKMYSTTVDEIIKFKLKILIKMS